MVNLMKSSNENPPVLGIDYPEDFKAGDWRVVDELPEHPMNVMEWHATAPKEGVLDTQIGGSHYKDMKIQPVEFIVANDIPYREGGAIKYICRHKNKNGVEDLKKAVHYLEMIIEEYENNE